jgi:hypothetical protein
MYPTAHRSGLGFALILLVWLTPTAIPAAETSADQAGIEFFEKKIRPVLVEQCYKCHSAESDELKGGLRVDTRDGIRQGGESGHAVVPGDLESSLLIGAIRYESFEMPPERKLPDAIIADFEAWVRMGAPDPRDGAAPPVAAAETPKPAFDLAAARQFWSFVPPQRHVPPPASDPGWIKRPIDAFILGRLDQAGLTPSPPADRRTLIRRVTFDLVGLPPTPEEVEAFVNDQAPNAYERVVERLLSSPHYGERWARMWLDLARYAEDQAHIVGSDTSLCYPNAYLYRDWVIAALNRDLPYDQFITLQLAADFVDDSQLPALGFIGLGPKYYRRNAPEVMNDEWEDRVDTVARSLLGLTVACARCHDHKFDPIPTEDYYALAGVFASVEMFNKPLDGSRETKNDGEAKKPEDALHIIREGKPTDVNILVRGDVKNQGPLVPRRFLQVLSPAGPQRFQNGSGRLELALAITDRANPLTARVLVNRVWGQNFGQGLVGTPSNFGALGERPTHPELLDDLAVRFMESGWSLKWLQREIVFSATYRQSSHIDATKQAADPANQLLWRMNRRRLDVERWRDAVLAAVGRLDPAVAGRSIEPSEPEERRRTIYSMISRFELNKMLAMFDFPDPNTHADRRSLTTTPLQKLFVLNSPFMIRQADALTARLKSVASNDKQRINQAYLLLYGRTATEPEVRLARQFLGSDESQRAARWPEYAQALLASNEMLMLD